MFVLSWVGGYNDKTVLPCCEERERKRLRMESQQNPLHPEALIQLHANMTEQQKKYVGLLLQNREVLFFDPRVQIASLGRAGIVAETDNDQNRVRFILVFHITTLDGRQHTATKTLTFSLVHFSTMLRTVIAAPDLSNHMRRLQEMSTTLYNSISQEGHLALVSLGGFLKEHLKSLDSALRDLPSENLELTFQGMFTDVYALNVTVKYFDEGHLKTTNVLIPLSPVMLMRVCEEQNWVNFVGPAQPSPQPEQHDLMRNWAKQRAAAIYDREDLPGFRQRIERWIFLWENLSQGTEAISTSRWWRRVVHPNFWTSECGRCVAEALRGKMGNQLRVPEDILKFRIDLRRNHPFIAHVGWKKIGDQVYTYALVIFGHR